LLKTGGRDFNAETLKRFFQSSKSLFWHKPVTDWGFHGAGVDAITDFEQLVLTNYSTQCTTDLVIASEIAEVGAKKYVTVVALNAFHNARFQGSCSHVLSLTLQKHDILRRITPRIKEIYS